MEDANARRPLLTKGEYKLRIRSVMASDRSQRAAKNIANSLRKTCQEVVDNKGAASRG